VRNQDHIFRMKVDERDLLFLSNFPGLKLKNKILLYGKLSFYVDFDRRRRKYIIYNGIPKDASDNFIHDSYDIEIDLSSVNIYRNVRETGRKIEKVAVLKGKKYEDLHLYKDSQKVCLIGYFDENLNIQLQDFLLTVVIPFFYDQSFYEKFDKWPRGSYSHGLIGILENYHDTFNMEEGEKITKKCLYFLKEVGDYGNKHMLSTICKLIRKKKIRGHWMCLCKERKRFNICHKKAFLGIRLLKKNIRKFNLAREFEDIC
jgi:hypothetical protein